MKKFFILIIPILFSLQIFAQSGRGQVTLKNGSKIKGRILSRNENGDVVIKSRGNIWNFEASTVDTVFYTYDEVLKPNEEEEAFRKKNFKLFNQVEAGFLIANPENEQDLPFSFHYSLNYKATDKFSIGAGTGVEFLKETHLPVFLHLQYAFRNELFTPLIFLKTGYQLPVEDSRSSYNELVPDGYYVTGWPGDIYYNPKNLSSKGGVILNPGVGFRGMFSRNFGISCTFGYRYSRLRYAGEDSYKIDVDYNRLTFMLGIVFH